MSIVGTLADLLGDAVQQFLACDLVKGSQDQRLPACRHGVTGLCLGTVKDGQHGAQATAKAGKSWQQILERYYPKAQCVRAW